MTETQGTAGQEPAYDTGTQTTGWVGWIIFAGIMMFMIGSFHAIEGLVALFKDEYYLVRPSGLVIDVDYTAWGWTHLLFGILVAIAGLAAMAGQTWARVVGVALAVLSALINITFLAAYPVWSTIIITLDVFVIYALVVHGSEARALR
jgi:hypothetical protein